MVSRFQRFSRLFIRTDSDCWEEVILLHNVHSLKWVVLDHSDSAVIKDFAELGCRPFPPRSGRVLSILERPTGEELEEWETFAHEIALLANSGSSMQTTPMSITPAAKSTASDPSRNRDGDNSLSEDLRHIECTTPSLVTRCRGRGRSSSQTRSSSEPLSNPQSGGRRTSEPKYMSAFGYGFQRFAKQAICEFTQDHAESVEPRCLGIHEADLVLRMLTTEDSRVLLPRQFVWQSAGVEFQETSVIVFEMKSSVRGATVAANQLRSRFSGLALDHATPIHLVLLVHCTEDEFAHQVVALHSAVDGEPFIHLVCTHFCSEAALQSDNVQSGFSRPLSVRFRAAPEEITAMDSVESMEQQMPSTEGDSYQNPLDIPNTSAAQSVNATQSDAHTFQLESFLGHWEVTTANNVIVVSRRDAHDDSLKVSIFYKNTAPSDLDTPAARARQHTLSLNQLGTFTCGSFSLVAAESSSERVVWRDLRDPRSTVIWKSRLRLESFLGAWSISNGQTAVVSRRDGNEDSLAVKFLWGSIDPNSPHAEAINSRFRLKPGSRVGRFTCGAFRLHVAESSAERRVWIDQRDPDARLIWNRHTVHR